MFANVFGWYEPTRKAMEQHAWLMIATGALLSGIGIWLAYQNEWPLLAAYLTYLLLP
jgi:hypothetical protein